MKDANFIISKHFLNNPLYARLSTASQCRTLIDMLPATVKHLVAFAYARGTTLFIAVRHPVGLVELKRDSSIKTIKGLLRALELGLKACGGEFLLADIKDIKFFITHTISQNSTLAPVRKTALRAKGEFKNLAKRDDVRAGFERLRVAIKERNCKA